ncbi:MAG: hypothetical protein V3U76_20385 [Granulosicoccus sp.]
MTKTNLNLTAILIATLLTSGNAIAETLWLENQGVVAIEVEDGDIASGWTSRSNANGYLGAGYLEWTGANHMSKKSAGNGKLSYHFRIKTAGNYELRWRNRIAQGSSNTEHNDSWVRFPTASNVNGEYPLDGWTKVYMNKRNDWYWFTYTKDHDGRNIRQHFNAGDHVIEISGRSSGHAIDRFVLYRYEQQKFSANTFDAFSPSATVNDTVQAAPATEATAATATTEPDSTTTAVPEEPAASPPANNNTAGQDKPTETTPAASQTATTSGPIVTIAEAACSDDHVSLQPINDVYLEAGRYLNKDLLRIEMGRRQSLLKFDLSAISGISEVNLAYTVHSDSGNGTLSAWLASHNNWPSTDGHAAGAPDASLLLGESSGEFRVGKRYNMALDTALPEGNLLTVRLDMQTAGNDIAIAASENVDAAGPRLEITGSAGFCERYTQARATGLTLAAANTSEESNLPVGSLENAEASAISGLNPGGATAAASTSGWIFLLLSGSLFARRATAIRRLASHRHTDRQSSKQIG